MSDIKQDANPSTTGRTGTAGFGNVPNTKAGTSDPVQYGDMADQSVRMDSEPAPRPTNQGNCLPPVPPIIRGVR